MTCRKHKFKGGEDCFEGRLEAIIGIRYEGDNSIDQEMFTFVRGK